MILPATIHPAGNNKLLMVLFACCYAVIALMGLQHYIKPASAQFILGTLAVASSLVHGKADRQVLRFGIAALLFLIIYLFLPAKTLLFISLSMALVTLSSSFNFRSNLITVFSVGMMSPLFGYATSMFSFPIKIYLTAAAASIMRLVQHDIRAEGNIIVSGTSEFSVDTACLGLHMLNTSMLAGLIILSHFAKKQANRVTFAGVVVSMSIVFLLNVVSNLFRIVCLVFLKIAPGTIMHDAIGIACFMVYVIGPMLYLVPRCLKFFGRRLQTIQQDERYVVSKGNLVINVLLLLILSIAVIFGRNKSLNGELIPLKNVSVSGYATTQLEHRVTKLSNSEALIYIKPIAGFFSSDHQPMLCWSGSGYEFTRVRETEINGTKVYTALLEKGNDRLFTAWWYDNGISTTISHFEWRWDALKTQQHYAIINVTAATPAILEKEAGKILSLKLGKRS